MAGHAPKVKCPFCEGRGEIDQLEFAENIGNPELRKRLDVRIAEILERAHLTAATPRSFERDVHTWNPQLPMWRRSPKE